MEAPLESLALRWSDSNFESGQVRNWKLINSIQETLQNPASNNVKVLSNVYANSLNMNVMTKFFVTLGAMLKYCIPPFLWSSSIKFIVRDLTPFTLNHSFITCECNLFDMAMKQRPVTKASYPASWYFSFVSPNEYPASPSILS